MVFVVPVNATINPFLYTFTTPTFRTTVRDLFRRTVDYASVATAHHHTNSQVARAIPS